MSCTFLQSTGRWPPRQNAHLLSPPFFVNNAPAVLSSFLPSLVPLCYTVNIESSLSLRVHFKYCFLRVIVGNCSQKAEHFWFREKRHCDSAWNQEVDSWSRREKKKVGSQCMRKTTECFDFIAKENQTYWLSTVPFRFEGLEDIFLLRQKGITSLIGAQKSW